MKTYIFTYQKSQIETDVVKNLKSDWDVELFKQNLNPRFVKEGKKSDWDGLHVREIWGKKIHTMRSGWLQVTRGGYESKAPSLATLPCVVQGVCATFWCFFYLISDPQNRGVYVTFVWWWIFLRPCERVCVWINIYFSKHQKRQCFESRDIKKCDVIFNFTFGFEARKKRLPKRLPKRLKN